MLIRLADDDPRPLHEQVASAIRRAIAAGRRRPAPACRRRASWRTRSA
ncbi:hypothetical protein [Actinomadura sp. J1-007]|nr:hypothetical protein [Actinomadura sp. J1-007]